MAVLSQLTSKIAGTQVTYVAASAGGDTFPANDRAHLHVKNGSGASITVTVVTPGTTKYGQADPDVAVAVPAGQEYVIGPFPADLANPADSRVAVTYSAVASLTVAYIGV